jgi:beta-glucanase (GH16 family)
MKFRLLSLLLALSVSYTNLIAQSCWSEVWSDDFTGSSLNTADWNYDTGTGCPGNCGWGNNEKEYYTNSTQNVSVSGGYLNIIAKYSADYAGSGYNFTSGKIHTRNKHYWTNGRFEASMKLPAGTGTWPAFWMLPQSSPYGGWPTSGEIDVMEFRGDITNKVDGTLHYGNSYPNNQHDGTGYTLSSGNFSSGFHLFAVEWDTNEIRWYVDGILYKTEKKSPNTLNPASNNAVTWPWDNDFYIILNLALGGWYTGDPTDNAVSGGSSSWTATMQVDYVKVYTDLSGGALTGNITGKSSALPNETGMTYSIPSTASASYAWTVTGGSIVSGQGTNSISVDWGTNSGSVAVTKTIACGNANYSLPVTIMPVACGTMLEDFENIRFSNYGFINGQFTQKNSNPNSSVENTSPFCGQYIRNSSEQYDVLIINNPAIGNADLIENNSKRFMFDIYSNAAGRNIEITLEDNTLSTPTNYPTGRHSTYRATTTKVNQWETLTFNWVTSPHAALPGANVNQITMLFEPNTYNGTTYFYDNLLLNEVPLISAISGLATVTNNQASVTYSVTNTSGFTYNWTVPADAIINSGQGTNSINVTFGVLGGSISVAPVFSGCTGATVTKTITNNAPTATTSSSMALNLSVFPNPVGDNMIIKLNNDQSGNIKVQIMESTGRILSEYECTSQNEFIIPVTQLNAGYYLIRITNGDNSVVKGMFKN